MGWAYLKLQLKNDQPAIDVAFLIVTGERVETLHMSAEQLFDDCKAAFPKHHLDLCQSPNLRKSRCSETITDVGGDVTADDQQQLQSVLENS